MVITLPLFMLLVLGELGLYCMMVGGGDGGNFCWDENEAASVVVTCTVSFKPIGTFVVAIASFKIINISIANKVIACCRE